MDFLSAYLVGLLAILVFMTALWLISLAVRNSSIVDIFWGAGFVVVCFVYFALTPDGALARKLLITALVTVWGLRLSLHIGSRNLGQDEDFRYAKWREEAGAAWWWRSYFKVFLLQGAVMWIVSAPLLAAQISPQPGNLGLADMLGTFVWAVGFLFETVGDWQLSRFKQDPANAGQVYDGGLWRYTRHPNYFGDAVQWWGLWLLAFAGHGWWTVFSPALMTFLLVRVSGVAMLEKSLKEAKPAYRDYIKRTPAFFPWLPRTND